MDDMQNHEDQEALKSQDSESCANAEGLGEAPAQPASGEFKEHFAKLSKCVDTLRSQTSADLDELLPLVDEALASYKFCKSRIESVKALLDERLSAAKEESERGE